MDKIEDLLLLDAFHNQRQGNPLGIAAGHHHGSIEMCQILPSHQRKAVVLGITLHRVVELLRKRHALKSQCRYSSHGRVERPR